MSLSLGLVWYHSEPSEDPYSIFPKPVTGQELFLAASILQQTVSNNIWNSLSIWRNISNLIYITLSGTSEAVAAGCKKDQTPARPIWSFSSQLLSTGLKAIQWVRSFFSFYPQFCIQFVYRATLPFTFISKKPLFSSHLEISHMLNGIASEIQHRKWGPKKRKKISILALKYTFLVQKVFGCECKNQLNKKLGLLPQKSLLFLKGEKMQQNLL